MKTCEIMNTFMYEALGGPIKAVPVTDVIRFCERIINRVLYDGIDPVPELKQTIGELEKAVSQ